MARPAMAALNETLSSRKILITQRGPHRFLFEDLNFDDILELPMASTATGREFDLRHLDPLPVGGLFISGVPWTSRSLEALRSQLRPNRCAGFFPKFDIQIPANASRNWVPRLFALARECGAVGEPADYRLPPKFSARARGRIERLLGILPRQAKKIVFHLDTVPSKMWRTQYWQNLMVTLLDLRRDYFLITVGLEPAPALPRYGDRVLSLEQMRLEESMLLVSRADGFAGIDSCMLHVADLSLVPLVGVYVSTDPDEFGPVFAPNLTIDARAGNPEEAVARAALFLSSV